MVTTLFLVENLLFQCRNVLGFYAEKLTVDTALGNNSASYAHFGHEKVSWLDSSHYAEDIFSEALGLNV